MYPNIRWTQRFQNFSKALSQLQKFIEKYPSLNDMEKQGLTKSFEYVYELVWNTIKDFYTYQGKVPIQGSRDAIKLAFQRGLIQKGEAWMKMLEDRNLTSHTYNETLNNEITHHIVAGYYSIIY